MYTVIINSIVYTYFVEFRQVVWYKFNNIVTEIILMFKL